MDLVSKRRAVNLLARMFLALPGLGLGDILLTVDYGHDVQTKNCLIFY